MGTGPGVQVFWGSDPVAMYGSSGRENLRSALLNGAKLIMVDPRQTDIAKRADLWIRPRPASDGALAMGVIKVLIEEKLYVEDFIANWTVGFDELREHVKTFTLDDVETVTWVPKQQVVEFARLLSQNQPASIRKGNPLDNILNSFQTKRALTIISTLSGRIWPAGGGGGSPMMKPGHFVFPKDIPAKREMSKVLGPEYKLAIQGNFISREILMKTILEEKPYPIRTVLFYLTNPLVSYANTEEVYRALMKVDFIAGADILPTPTTALADILLPAAWGAEMEMAGWSRAMPKLIDPPGEAWPDAKWINELGKKMGMPGWWDKYEDVFDEIWKPGGVTWEDLKEARVLYRVKREPRKPEVRKPEETVSFKTPSGKVEIYCERLKEMGYSPMPNWEELSRFRFELSDEYPLLMTNDKESAYYLTGYKHVKGLREKMPQPLVRVHPETARKAGLKEGEWINIETKTGKIKQILALEPSLDPRVICCAFGWWFPEDPEDLFQFRKSNVNVLVDSDPPYDPQTSSPNVRGIPCRISGT